uniref:beta-N-acetylhexosaminidase n=1 Tax=Magnetococcus massalia (strain MO-1) TaxID=451514 RepID=A0A1S7LH40_MAGMO|nr:GH3 : Beta-N-acetylhexosaminidase [Candidatus Magnetococcus massalia]
MASLAQRGTQPGDYLVMSLSGPGLTVDERAFIRDVQPAGVILFSRNIEDPDQVAILVEKLQSLASPAIWIDQEGGRVQRLRAPLTRLPPAIAYADYYRTHPQGAVELAEQSGALCGRELASLGIGINCAPVLDIPAPGADPVIGNRAFGQDPHTITTLAGAWLQGLQSSGVLGVAKHFPGHGDALVDSHKALPVVESDEKTLWQRTWAPYRTLRGAVKAVMTAHLVMSSLDAREPATCSTRVLQEGLRHRLGFAGLIISDALEMGALSGSMEDRAARAVRAGCDQLLACTGQLDQVQRVLRGIEGAWLGKSAAQCQQERQRIHGILEPYHPKPSSWRQVVEDPQWLELRARLARLWDRTVGVDPTE